MPPPTQVTVESSAVLNHVSVIGARFERLDEVVQGFLKFSRPEELTLEPVDLGGDGHRRRRGRRPAGERGRRAPRDRAVRRPAAGQRRQQPAPAGAAQPGAERRPGDAARAASLRFEGRRAADRQVELAVADTGVGIPPEHLSRIFDLYFTTKDAGSGIGLSMVYRTIQLHDGHIEVQSTPGRGTTFTIRLPQAA